jgi:type IV pilus assembly protein PilM
MADNPKKSKTVKMGLKDILNIYLDLVKRFVPAAKTRSLVGVDLSAGSCKMVELKTGQSGPELIGWAIEPIAAGDAKEALRKVLGKLNQPTTKINTAVYGKGTLVRYLEMPKLGLEDLRKSFAFEVDKYFPFPKDQIFTDCHILNAREKENKILVLAAAAKKEMVTQRQGLLKELGLEADFITLNSLAISNLFPSSGPRNNAAGEAAVAKATAVAVVDIGEKISNLTIISNGEPRFTRDIFLGGEELTLAISHALAVDLKNAEELKCSPGDQKEEVAKAGESWVTNLSGEVRLSFDYFVTEKNIPVTEVLLTGGGALAEGLAEAFGKCLEMPVRLWDPLANIKVAEGLPVPELKKQVNRLSVAIGLALSD